MKNAFNIIRWILVLPMSIIAAIVILFPLHWILIFSLNHFVTPYPELPERLLTPFVFSLTFVLTGSKIAPNYKFYSSVFLFSIFMLLTGVYIWFISNNIKWFGEVLMFQNGGVPFYFGIIGSFTGLYLVSKDLKNADYEYNFNKLFKELAPYVLFFLLFIFCIFNPTFRFIVFLLYFIFASLLFIYSIKNKFYSSNKLKFKLFFEFIFLIALLFGIIYKDIGLIVSFICLIQITVGYIWYIIINFKKESSNNLL
jgi:hypothetical protein